MPARWFGDRLRRALHEPILAGIDIDSGHFIDGHRAILKQKPMLRQVFAEIYDLCRTADERHLDGRGLRLELGSGSSFLQDRYPDIYASDIKVCGGRDLSMDAQMMCLADASVRALYAIHCFHHLPQPRLFFSELERVLVPGGGCILVEPYHGRLAAVLYRHLFSRESFDPSQESWEASASDIGPMSGANQALSYIVFERDLRILQSEFPQLELVEQRRLHNYARYLGSGGLNYRQLLPSWLAPAIQRLENALTRIDSTLALHHLLVLRKKSRSRNLR